MKKIIVRIAEGLGNQLFMYSHAYSLSKKLGYELQIDNTSGYFKTKNRLRNYELDKFNISTPTCDDNDKFDTYPKDFKRKLLKMLYLLFAPAFVDKKFYFFHCYHPQQPKGVHKT